MQLAPWPPPNHMVALPTTGIPMMAVPELCARHRPPAWLLSVPQGQLLLRVLAAFRELPDVEAECGNDPQRFVKAARLAAPLCCAIGDKAMAEINRQVVGVRALEN